MNISKYVQSKILATVLATVTIGSLLVGCGGGGASNSSPSATESPIPITTPPPTSPAPTTAEAGFVLAKSSVERDVQPEVPGTDLDALVQGNNAFAFDLYRELLSGEGNLFFSPYSISTALAMTYAGARGQTEQQMADTLHFMLPQDALHAAFNALNLRLVSDDQEGKSDKKTDFTLRIANSLWGEKDHTFLPEFLDTLARNYGAGMRLVDFIHAPEEARLAINKWVSDQTEEKIKDLIPQGAITDLTRLVLANAIYFYADWLSPFEHSATHDAPFTLLDGQQVTVPMMSRLSGFEYAQGEDYQAVELPYAGGKAAMTIIVPDSGSFTDFEAGLNAERLEAILERLERRQVDLKLPKFSYKQSISMADMLAKMGMPDAFDPKVADFSGMDGTRLLYITNVFHKAFVAVDEEGTEAAAATAVVVGLESMPMVDVSLTIDRPFIYLIRDTDTGSILFMGRVLNPSE